jgi:hypothetical protein
MQRRLAELAKARLRELEQRQGIHPTLTIVDGRQGAPEASVRPDGVVVYLIDVASSGARRVLEALRAIAPEDTGEFKRGFITLVDGKEAPLDTAPAGASITLLDRAPYSRRLEKGWSLQAPDGVFEVTAKAMRRRLPNLVVRFAYRFHAGRRTPAIIIESKVF